MDLPIEERGAVDMISFNQSEYNPERTLAHPLSRVVSDGAYVNGRPHPPLHGTFSHRSVRTARERRVLTLSEAIRKITSAPAERFHMHGLGWIA
jgi:N-acyl-D-amino-acid deacylase